MKYIRTRLEKEQADEEPTYTEPSHKEKYYRPMGDDGRKQQERTNTPGDNTDRRGDMANRDIQDNQRKRMEMKEERSDTKRKQQPGTVPNVREDSLR